MNKFFKKVFYSISSIFSFIFVLWFISQPNQPKARLKVVQLKNFEDNFESNEIQEKEDYGKKKLFLKERYCKKFKIGGFLFSSEGVARNFDDTAVSCLVHSFSPQLEFEASRRFLDPPREYDFYGNSPALLMLNNEVLLVSRIWLGRENFEEKGSWPANHFSDNWLFMQKFDNHMTPINYPSILGIPAPKQWWVGDGPIEPRLFACQNQLFISFNAAMAFAKNNIMDYTVLWNINKSLPIIPEIQGGTPMVNATEKNDMPRDKHWMPLIIKDQLYFVHNLDPFRVLTCSLEGKCKWAYKEEGHGGFIFSDAHSHLRGGTPFEHYRHPYYISIAHTTMYKKNSFVRYYSAHVVMIRVFPFRIIYLSHPIRVNKKIFLFAPMVRKRYIEKGFIFPVGLIIEENGDLSIGVHVNDRNSVITRIKGMKEVLDKMIDFDVSNPSKHGPPSGFLNGHIHSLLQNLTHMHMEHQTV